MATKQVEVTPEAAAELRKPIEAAERRSADFARVCDLEYALIRTRDALAVVTRGLGDFVDSHAGADENKITQDDASFLFGAVNLLECVAADCDRAVNGKA